MPDFKKNCSTKVKKETMKSRKNILQAFMI